jgi:hypothetical protein
MTFEYLLDQAITLLQCRGSAPAPGTARHRVAWTGAGWERIGPSGVTCDNGLGKGDLGRCEGGLLSDSLCLKIGYRPVLFPATITPLTITRRTSLQGEPLV